MKKILLLLLLLTTPAYAGTPREALSGLNACVEQQDAESCLAHLTVSSAPLFDRFAKLKLMHCLPHPATLVSERAVKSHRILRVRAKLGEEPRHFRLWLVEEEGAWKLDIPASLEASLGKNWEKTVNATEALYVMMKQQLGDRLGCAIIQGMAEDQARAR